jgi:phospholipid-binding lipoprotein MlaA
MTSRPDPDGPGLGAFFLAALIAALMLAAPPEKAGAGDVKRPVSVWVDENTVYPIDVYDPIETANRWIYQFNAMFDRYVFYPAAQGYIRMTPRPVRNSVTRFFSNLMEVRNFMNNLLQGKAEGCVNATMRFVINTSLGLGGLFDPATDAGYPEMPEDFGQTLGVWGLDPGPYLVLPVLGPSSLRDTGGLAVDGVVYWVMTTGAADRVDSSQWSKTAISAALSGLRAVNTRAGIKFRYYETGSPFEYELLRLLYTKKREIEVAN